MSDEEMDFGGDGFGDDGDDAAFGDGGFGDDGDDAAFGDGGFGDEEDLAGFDMNDTSDYNFNYGSGSEPDNDLEVQISNCYHTSKELISSDSVEALQGFESILEMEPEKGEWGFKALKQMVKLRFTRQEYSKMMDSYAKLLTYIRSAVTRNNSEKVINALIEFVSTSTDMVLLQDFYEKTLTALASSKNDRLWFKTNLKLGKLRFEREEYAELAVILKELRKSCQLPDGTEDLKKGTQLLEIYALEIQMYTAQKNNKMLKKLYDKSLQVQSGIPHPKIMAVIRECGGKMHMAEENWGEAYKEFFEAFKNYDEAGSGRRIQSLKFMVIANLLDLSNINPFTSPEAASYKNDPQIVAISSLVAAYEQNDTKQFEKIFLDNKDSIMDDKFISTLIEEKLLKNIRMKGLEKIIGSYTRVKIDFLSSELNIPSTEVQTLLVSMILDNKIRGRIDQVNQILLLEMAGSAIGSYRYEAIDKWTRQLNSLNKAVIGKLKD